MVGLHYFIYLKNIFKIVKEIFGKYWNKVCTFDLSNKRNKTHAMNLIINRNEKFSTYNGQYITTDEARKIMIKALKEGRAKLLVDSTETLGYQID